MPTAMQRCALPARFRPHAPAAVGRTNVSGAGERMPSFIFLAPVVALGLVLVPIGLLRRKVYARAQDYFVSSNPTRLNVIQNSSISYALKVAFFFPLFGWGAGGDLWPAAVVSVSFGLGLWITYMLRRPLFGFLGTALSRDGSITMSAFIAQQHGNDRRLRLLASGLTLLALVGLAVAETLGVATILSPVVSESIAAVFAVIFGFLMIVVVYTALAGNSGVLHATQLQLGLLYLGLFGATALLLYLQVSELTPVPPHGMLAVLFIAALCIVMPFYRRVRYIETGPVRDVAVAVDDAYVRPRVRGVKRLVTIEKILNLCISVLSGFAAAFALMELYFAGFPTVVGDSIAALQAGTSLPGIALVALFLLPLFGQIVDVTNWQRIAVFEKDRDPNDPELNKRLTAFRRMWTTYAIETPVLWLFLCAFGALAAVSTATPDGAHVMRNFVRQLASQENFVAASALSLLLVGVLAMALSTMSPLLCASLCVVRYDVLPAMWPEPEPGEARARSGRAAAYHHGGRRALLRHRGRRFRGLRIFSHRDQRHRLPRAAVRVRLHPACVRTARAGTAHREHAGAPRNRKSGMGYGYPRRRRCCRGGCRRGVLRHRVGGVAVGGGAGVSWDGWRYVHGRAALVRGEWGRRGCGPSVRIVLSGTKRDRLRHARCQGGHRWLH